MKKLFTKLLLDQPHNVILKHLKTRAKDVSKQQVSSLTKMPVVPFKRPLTRAEYQTSKEQVGFNDEEFVSEIKDSLMTREEDQ